MTASAQLQVEPLADGCWRVTGGTEPHLVEADVNAGLRCDCPGYRYRSRCRHVDTVNAFERGGAGEDPPAVGAGPGLELDIPPPDDAP